MTVTKALRIGPIARLAFGLMALLVSLFLLADMLLGAVPARGETDRAIRKHVAENLALQITSLVEAGDTPTLGKTIQQVLARDADIRAIGVRRSDGSMLVQRGLAPNPAEAVRPIESTTDRLRVPIFAGREAWGEIDIRFAPAPSPSVASWLAQPNVQLVLVLGLGGFALSYLYLRRAMHFLDPSASVPDRVRKAFDSLAEGLLIVDQQARIVLANKAFRQLHPRAEGELNGRPIDSLDWLIGAAPGPWVQTLRTAEPVNAQPLELPQPAGAPTQWLVSSAAITDDKGRARGCLITFDNVTAIHRANAELRHTLGELESSRQHIEAQNGELRRLASRDPLTGCFNRRAFFESAEVLFEQARRQQTPLSCLMIDIDHFKQFNDRYGHAVGDQVIQAVARALGADLRQADVLARYGGEEFCIVLPGLVQADAAAVAERLRADIEAGAARAIRSTEVPTITASFGLASLNAAARSIEVLIDQADQALYRAKQAGRNRVTTWALAPVNTRLLEARSERAADSEAEV